ncbi:VOC family protein [Cryobacterium sp. PAMC25264]|uniref:VOC family protein n=1 Tax=Cryobacterium sp. PAMC25264 TaxID=2861288 RepID=UPI001C634D86|nr:VOC family protein [Cryobacterium sp. PAMC25264]QYF72739.1 VOC family protein [Cryobacterium sp. PAMC25264]
MPTIDPEYLHGFSGFAVPDIEAARTFYADVLGLEVADGGMGMLRLTLPGGADVIIYPKPDHQPAVFTILNLEVADINQSADVLAERGVEFLRYDFDGFEQDERGIANGNPRIAWFTDPAGNILSVLQN